MDSNVPDFQPCSFINDATNIPPLSAPTICELHLDFNRDFGLFILDSRKRPNHRICGSDFHIIRDFGRYAEKFSA